MRNMDCKILFASMLLLSMSVFTGCDKRYTYPYPLRVTAENISLNMYAGESRIVVYSNTAWTARMVETVTWATLTGNGGEGIGDVLFTYSENPSIARKAVIELSASNVKDTVTFIQAGAISAPSFNFKETIATIGSEAGEYEIGFDTDIPDLDELIKASAIYYFEGDPLREIAIGEDVSDFPLVPWITLFRYDSGKVIITVSANEGDQKRSADLFAILDNGLGISYKVSIRVRQSANL